MTRFQPVKTRTFLLAYEKKKNFVSPKKKPFYLFYPFFILQKTTLKFFIFLFFTLNPDHACLRVTKNE